MSDAPLGRPTESEQRGEHLAVSALVFALVVPLTYSLQRAFEYLRGEHGDPRLVLMTLHTVYYWRAGIALWWGACAGALVYLWLRGPREPASTPHAEPRRWLVRAAWTIVPINVAASYFMP